MPAAVEPSRGLAARRTKLALPRWLGALDLVWLAAGTGALCAAGVITSRSHYLWYDELATWSLVSDPSVTHMVRAIGLGAENNPPLYHLILRGWAAVAGTGTAALRAFTTLMFCVAFALMWSVLRSRGFSVRATALGCLTAFCTSVTVVEQVGSARFYGLFTALCLVAVIVTLRLCDRGTPGLRELAANGAVVAALAYTHLFGLLYGGALLAVVAVLDLVRRRFRPAVYASFLLGWATFIPWVKPTQVQADLGKPRSLFKPPQLSDALDIIHGNPSLFSLVVVAAIVLLAAEWHGRWTLRGSDGTAGDTSFASTAPTASRGPRGDLALALVAASLVAMPIAVFVESRLRIPILQPRYLLPSIVGWGFVLAQIVAAGEAALDGSARPAWLRGAWTALTAALPLWLVALARLTPPDPSPRLALEPLARRGGPIVVEAGMTFRGLRDDSRSVDDRYVFPLDSTVAFAPGSVPPSIQLYKILRIYAREGYLGHSVTPSAPFLCATPRFLVLDDPAVRWFETRIAPDPAFTSTPALTLPDGAVVRDVARVPGRTPVECSDSEPGNTVLGTSGE